MSKFNIVRAWKDEDYRNSLTKAELALLPNSPAGMIELGDEELQFAGGGRDSVVVSCCVATATNHSAPAPRPRLVLAGG